MKKLNKVITILRNDKFFYAVLLLFALQALWYVFSIQPGLFDEVKHLDKIAIYAQHLNPFLGYQQTSWDHVGAITRDGSYMFYYLMSWPFRTINLFTDNRGVQVISLRLICLTSVLVAMIIYRKAFLRFRKLDRSLIHSIFLVVSLMPSIVMLAGSVNYDNIVLLLFSVAFLLAIKIIDSGKLNFVHVTSFFTLCLFATIVKYTNIVLFLPLAAFVAYQILRRHGTSAWHKLLLSANNTPRLTKYLLIIASVIVLGLFIERPMINVVRFGSIDPDCTQLMSHQRCMSSYDYAFYNKIDSTYKTADFKPENPIAYGVKYWLPRMLNTQNDIFELGRASWLPIAGITMAIGTVAGALSIAIHLPVLVRDKNNQLILSVIVFYTSILFISEYIAYTRHGVPSALRFRYLIPIFPLFLYLAGLSMQGYIRKYKITALTAGVCFVLLMTQGGGVIYMFTTPAMQTHPDIYWHNSNLREINRHLEDISKHLIVR